MIDCHAHLADEDFVADLDAVLDRARVAGVREVVVVAEGLEDIDNVLELARSTDMLRACIGLHPERADEVAADRICELIRAHASELVGIGEVGLDYWLAKEQPERELQRHVLKRFVAVSKALDLPLNVHSRSAGHYTIDLLKSEGATKVLMHAFDGKASYALAGVEAGYYFSIPPSIVRSPQKQKLVKRLPLNALLLETDSPVLGPEKGERNEPANALRSAQMIAEIKEVALEEVIESTNANAAKLFGLSLG